jgi:hypothetical protein
MVLSLQLKYIECQNELKTKTMGLDTRTQACNVSCLKTEIESITVQIQPGSKLVKSHLHQ